VTTTEADEVARLLDEMPAWSDVTSGNEAGLRAVESAVVVLAGRSSTAIVDGVSTFTQRAQAAGNGFDVAAMSKPFVAVRYLFAVPARVPIGRPGFASFTGIPVDGDFVDDLWPWELEPHQIPRLTGYFRGYVGETYLAAEEAAYFARTYGIRELPPQ
jgi:diadenosine tetraphosphatase ApaH/serine/threonine PP2A family protein phosphatase